MLRPYPAEFRRDVVAVARQHETPFVQIAKDFGRASWLLFDRRLPLGQPRPSLLGRLAQQGIFESGLES